jgi:ribosomal protein L18
VFRSVAHIYVQVIDDRKGQTLVSASSIEKAAEDQRRQCGRRPRRSES